MGAFLDSFESIRQGKENSSIKAHKHKAPLEKNEAENKTKEH